ncbi:hypothetical protein KIPB_000718 [Kipferlia bialata]|uniref:DOC domain-containing protein n=1 Tax=Kipferlia bialata TaxID=797122 RepID=A0A9K3CMS1_9EUKA|nr:hypothetical protein KIPB_000718 [Kipferlia bialata]|eukprot:g718.t1
MERPEVNLTLDGCWSATSACPAYGIASVVDGDMETFWQSEGDIPHTISTTLYQNYLVKRVGVYIDPTIDDSYCPCEIVVRTGQTQWYGVTCVYTRMACSAYPSGPIPYEADTAMIIGMTEEGVTRMLNADIGFAETVITGVPIPDLTGEGTIPGIADITYSLSDMSLTDVYIESVLARSDMECDPPVLRLTVDKIDLTMAFQYDIKDLKWPFTELSGSGTVFIEGSVNVGFRVAGQTANGLPKVDLHDFNLTMDDIDIQLTGSGAIFQDILNTLMDDLQDLFNDELAPLLFEMAGQALNDMLAAHGCGYESPSYGIVQDFRVSYPHLPVLENGGAFTVGGSMWDWGQMEEGVPLPRKPESLPLLQTDDDLQYFIDSVVFDTMYTANHASLKGEVNPSTVTDPHLLPYLSVEYLTAMGVPLDGYSQEYVSLLIEIDHDIGTVTEVLPSALLANVTGTVDMYVGDSVATGEKVASFRVSVLLAEDVFYDTTAPHSPHIGIYRLPCWLPQDGQCDPDI